MNKLHIVSLLSLFYLVLSTKLNVNSEINICEKGEISSSWGQSGSGTGCPERLSRVTAQRTWSDPLLSLRLDWMTS